MLLWNKYGEILFGSRANMLQNKLYSQLKETSESSKESCVWVLWLFSQLSCLVHYFDDFWGLEQKGICIVISELFADCEWR